MVREYDLGRHPLWGCRDVHVGSGYEFVKRNVDGLSEDKFFGVV